MTKGKIAATLVLLATVAFALAPLVRPNVAELPIPLHHLLHAMMIAGGALSGILLAGRMARERGSGTVWLVVAILAPVFAMLLMWPSAYSYLETHPYGHVVEHLGLVVLGLLTGYGGQRYAAGIGWASGIGITAMALLAIGGYGVAPTVATQTPSAQPATGALQAPNLAHGSALFAQNCAVCHGATGAGGAGPRLQNERSRKSLAQAEQWIENPSPPMPKLYPGTLSAQDVTDVAGYIETLM